ncbi:MAG: hypothetical protein GVY08_00080 [Bacteroidetes bacterium]|nr:hypothetical protein [Bacteroidota bacterium]
MEDTRNILEEQQPFDYKEIKDSKLQVFFHGKMIAILRGKDYGKFQRLKNSRDTYQIQLFLAKATGQFKHGNERKQKK